MILQPRAVTAALRTGRSHPEAEVNARLQPETQAVVYLWSMRDNEWTSAARLRPGDRVKLRLRPWPDVSAQYEKFNRTELDDSALQLEEPVWGENIELLKR